MKIEFNLDEDKINQLLRDDNYGTIEEKIAKEAKQSAVHSLSQEFLHTVKTNSWQSYDKDTFLSDVKKEIDTQLGAVIQKYIDKLLETKWSESQLEVIIGNKVRAEINTKMQNYVREVINNLEVVDTRVEEN